MEKELKDLMSEVLKDEYYVSSIKQALKEKIVEVIRFDFGETIKEAIKELFTEQYKKELTDIVRKEKENLREIMKQRIEELMIGLTNKIELNVNTWDFEKLLKDSIDVKMDKNP